MKISQPFAVPAGSVVDADVAAGANINLSKLDPASNIARLNIAGSEPLGGKLNLTNSTSGKTITLASSDLGEFFLSQPGVADYLVVDPAAGKIVAWAGLNALLVDADVNAAAAIAGSKIEPIVTAWTPNVGGTATYAAQEGRIISVGKLRIVQGHMTINVIGTGSTTSILGLPDVSDAAAPPASFAFSTWSNLALAPVFMSAYLAPGSTALTLQGLTAGGATMAALFAAFGNNASVVFSGVYKAA